MNNTLIIFLVSIVAIYIIFLVLMSSLNGKYTVLKKIDSVQLGGDSNQVRISTVILGLSKNFEVKKAGLVFMASLPTKVHDSALANTAVDFITPLSSTEIESIIEILKNDDAPFILNVDAKKRLKISFKKPPETSDLIVKPGRLFRHKFRATITDEAKSELINIFERLLKEEQAGFSP